MEPSEFPKLIKECPSWYLLQRADDLNKVIALLVASDNNETKQDLSMLGDIGFGILTGMFEPSIATEKNRYDYYCLISYLHQLRQSHKSHAKSHAMGISRFAWLALAAKEYMFVNQCRQELLAFLPGWIGFLLAEARGRRTDG